MRIEHNDCFGKADPLIMKMTSMKYIYHEEMKKSCLKNWQIVSINQKCRLCVFLHEINQFSFVQVTKNFSLFIKIIVVLLVSSLFISFDQDSIPSLTSLKPNQLQCFCIYKPRTISITVISSADLFVFASQKCLTG